MRPNLGLFATMAALVAVPSRRGGRTISVPDGTPKHKPKKRLRMARGAGSINAKADALQLARRGRWKKAADMAEAHRRQCHEHLFPQWVVDTWRQYGEAGE